MLDQSDKLALQQLLAREDTLSGLAALKQDAKHFGYQMMLLERQKRAALESVYRLMKKRLPAIKRLLARCGDMHFRSCPKTPCD
jgi:hypothetical protein